mgnify:FL=1
MSDTWGKGAKNNTIGWGSAACTTTNDWGKSQKDSSVAASWSGDTDISGCAGAALSITYSSSAFCEDASDPTPTVTDNVGAGTFSSTAGLVFVSTSTGEVDISASTSGATYVITYTDTDAATATFSLTINDLDDATFAYSQSSYSPTDADPTPTPVLSGGTFSAGSGLVFVDSGSNTGSSTGQIDLSASTIASYTVTYTTAGTCPNTSTQTVEIAAALAQVNNVYSMEFDPVSSQYIDAGNITSLNSQSSFSTSTWINCSALLTSPVVLSGGSSSSNRVYIQFVNSTTLRYVNGGDINDLTISNIADGNWHHISTVHSGTSLNIYLDGAKTSFTTTALSTNIGDSFTIGAYFTRTSNFWDGLIDEVGLFNTALTAQEIQNIYNATETGKTADLNDLTTPPVAWYRM